MAENILHYEIRENKLNNTETYVGKILHGFTYTNEAIIREMVRKNSTVTRQEAMAMISSNSNYE